MSGLEVSLSPEQMASANSEGLSHRTTADGSSPPKVLQTSEVA